MQNIIQGRPTKKFFIDMITRDISIEDAIIDLIDNSIDGANRLRPKVNSSFEGLYVKLSLNKDMFVIEDNCGGFSLETAQKYAFRFGRPDDIKPELNNSVGRFGIGMKRSLFKMGKHFSVESRHGKDHFKVEVDVDKWSKQVVEETDGVQSDNWDFSYVEVPNTEGLQVEGTYIKVELLNEEYKGLFDDEHFLTDLSTDIQRILNFSLARKIEITLNDKLLVGTKVELLMSKDDGILPYYREGKIDGVDFKIIAGIGVTGHPKESGWYIYCNNRLVVEADQSTITGWHMNGLPQWAVKHAMFRGLLFLDSAETIKLPLTTTKKGIDVTSSIYQSILPLMQDAMRKINTFLNDIDNLGANANDYRKQLGDCLQAYSAVQLKLYDFSKQPKGKFFAPKIDENNPVLKDNTRRISYTVSKEKADAALEHSGARSYKELGEKTFEYYTKLEGIDDEEY
jgi:hypothetical protein